MGEKMNMTICRKEMGWIFEEVRCEVDGTGSASYELCFGINSVESTRELVNEEYL
jgi:hypothetical protein